MSAIPKVKLTPAEYLAIERKASFKSQYYAGEMFAMSDATFEHNIIVSNLVRVFGNQLLDSECHILPSDMRIAIDPAKHYTYPDAVIVCADKRFVDNQFDSIINPKVIFEVLSDSTEKYDLGHKFKAYRKMPSVESIVYVRQDMPQVDVYTRNPDQSWLLQGQSGLEGLIEVPSVKVQVAMSEIYRNVVFKENEQESSTIIS